MIGNHWGGMADPKEKEDYEKEVREKSVDGERERLQREIERVQQKKMAVDTGELQVDPFSKPYAIDSTELAGYHVRKIEKGVVGELSKVREELEEALDAEEQGVKVMVLVELADLIGAVECYLERHHPGTTLEDLLRMKEASHRAWRNGKRR